MFQNNFNVVDYILALAQKPNAKENITLLLNNLFEASRKDESDKRLPSIVNFTTRDLAGMHVSFRKNFKNGKFHAHLKQRADNLWEIRCQINHTLFVATSKDLDVCKDKFIAKLNASDISAFQPHTYKVLLSDYIQDWLITTKKPFVKDVTYKDYIQTINAYILPKFKNRALTSLQHFELQNMLTGISESGKQRTAKKIYQILSPLFSCAVSDGILTHNPMAKVKLARYEQKHGVPLTREEEYTLLQEIMHNPTAYNQAYAFILYTGLRRSELASVEINGDWISLITAKQRKGVKEKSRSLPISPMLKKILHLIDVEEIKKLSVSVLTNRFKEVCPNHHLHDLRHTFITRAQECGIRREYVSLWAGHKADSSITSNVYTHLEQNKELQIDEMEKFDYKYD